jgi:fructan beta-fructosidase
MNITSLTSILPILITFGSGPRPDILVADFEGRDYGNWKVEGTAFGTKPARGTLPNQMPVTGFLGKGLVNSYHGGDDATGTLTSPVFTIQRRHINFLIGGGKYPGETCINLIVDKKVVRTATGPNDKSGGSEHLDWHSWDVKELEGKSAIIQIVDQRQGGWGHINIDHIVQTDRPKKAAGPARREMVVQHRYLHLPVKNGVPVQRMRLLKGGKTLREFDIELAPDVADFWVFLDVSAWKDQKVAIELDKLPAESKGLSASTQADALPQAEKLYRERDRPQFHFTARRGWLNDPNGLVFHKGEYHLFFQHNPYGWGWGNMHWGHAVSKDLVHWCELPIALYPQKFGDWCFSGSAVVDAANTSGFKKGNEDVLVAAYTSTGRGECIALSNDKGRTWQEYSGNPVVRHQGRDPRLLWHEPSKRWIMAVYDEHKKGRHIGFYSSPGLKEWQFQSRIEGFFECPDLFELPIQGTKQSKWILYAADGKYLVGHFDGKIFHKESGLHQLWHGNFYAAQTFSNAPHGRRIQIGWGQDINFAGMPFNQQMTIPVELTLRPTKDGPRMFAEPVEEIASLHHNKHPERDRKISEGEHVLPVKADLLHIVAEFELGDASEVGFLIHGVPVRYNAKKQLLSCRQTTAPLSLKGGKITMEILLDHGSIEVFGNLGQVAISSGGITAKDNRSLKIVAAGGTATVRNLAIYEMRSAWNTTKQRQK